MKDITTRARITNPFNLNKCLHSLICRMFPTSLMKIDFSEWKSKAEALSLFKLFNFLFKHFKSMNKNADIPEVLQFDTVEAKTMQQKANLLNEYFQSV